MTRTAFLTTVGLLHVSLILSGADGIAQEDVAADPSPPGLLASEPQTVEEHFEAALIMLRVDRPDFARHYLAGMLALQPDDETLLRLRDKHGTAMFLRLSQNDQLAPPSRELLARVQQAAANQLQDPAYFDNLIAELQSSPRDHDAAMEQLKHLGTDAVPEILSRLGAGQNAATRELLLLTLVRFGSIAVDPLLGAIEAPDPHTREVAIETLGWIGDESIIPRLWYPALGGDQPQSVQQAALRAIARIRFGQPHLTSRLDPVGAADEVYRGAVAHFRGDYPWAVESGGTLDMWTWDSAQNRLIRTSTTPAAASMLMAERLARQAMLMAPEREQHRALFLAAALAHSRYRAGWDAPLPTGPGTAHNLALFTGANLTDLALGLSVEHRNAAAAESAATVLGRAGSRDLLSPRAGHASPLIAALDFPNDRVQFAAATAIVQLDPVTAFPRSSRVIEILARSLRAEGGPRSVVIDPNTSRAVDTASVLDRLGYNTTVALTGQEGFRSAVEYGDVALAVLHPNTIRWELRQTIANLRADSRTANVAIVIAAGEPARADMQRLLDGVPHSTFVSTEGGADDWQRQLKPMLAQLDVPPLTPAQQGERVQAAAYWLRRIAQRSPSPVFDLAPAEPALSDVAARPDVGLDALAALGGIGRPEVQQRFVDLILAPAIEPSVSAAAARELVTHIQRHGRLVRQDSVPALTEAWSAASDPEVRTSLSAVLGALSPTPQAVVDRLRDYSLPEAPLP